MSDLLDDWGEKWQNNFRPTYDPDWGDGQIHLDGGKDFPADQNALEVVESLKERCEVVGGLCVHRPAKNEFSVSSQMGYLGYTVHYDDEHTITGIDLKENGEHVGHYPIEELKQYAKEVTKPLMEALESAEWTIEADDEPRSIHDL